MARRYLIDGKDPFAHYWDAKTDAIELDPYLIPSDRSWVDDRIDGLYHFGEVLHTNYTPVTVKRAQDANQWYRQYKEFRDQLYETLQPIIFRAASYPFVSLTFLTFAC